MTHIPSKELARKEAEFMEKFNVDPLNIYEENESYDYSTELFTEAVFKDGKKTMEPLIKHIAKIKEIFDAEIEEHEKSIKDAETAAGADGRVNLSTVKLFNPVKFWRNPIWKTFEDLLQKTFGFRHIDFSPVMEKYDSKKKEFETKSMNCAISHSLRYPIDGIVTDKGFYDKSRSLNMRIEITLGLLKALSAEEITAVLLHEIGHSIDPAVVDIKYTQVNILSKYLTDRVGAITPSERKFISKHKFDGGVVVMTIVALTIVAGWLFALWNIIKSIFQSDESKEKDRSERSDIKIQRIRDKIRKDPQFTRQNYGEAFADNFARMYGFGPQLISGLNKIEKNIHKNMRSRIQKEEDRQKAILFMVENALKGVHKTDIHRVRSLLKEYEEDLKDTSIPANVKKDIKADKEELEKILDQYLNSFDAFQNRINKIINDELISLEKKNSSPSSDKKEDSKSDDKDEKDVKKK